MVSKCYLCKSLNIFLVDGKVRDMPELPIWRCDTCGLVFLGDQDHIDKSFYKESRMRRDDRESDWDIDRYLKETDKDDMRRMEWLKNKVCGRSVLDFGCGSGGFLNKISHPMITYCAGKFDYILAGVEPDNELRNSAEKCFKIKVYPSINVVPNKFDIITAFHVLEHCKNPVATLKRLAEHLDDDRRIYIETPNSNDALLSLYGSIPFSKFYYIKSHLFIFNESNLRKVIESADLFCDFITSFQRYPISNTFYWLAKGKPHGHDIWPELDFKELNDAYERRLRLKSRCDTLWAVAEKKK